jgi:hypothetical protein
VSSAPPYPTHGQLESPCRQLRLETLQRSWNQGFSLSQTIAAPKKPIPIHTWPSDKGVPCVLYVSCVFYPRLSDVRQFIFDEMKPGTSDSEATTAELHLQRQRRNPQRALASCAFCQLIPAMRTSQQQTFPISPSSLIAPTFARIQEEIRKANTHQTQTTTAFALSRMARVSQGTIDQKKKSGAIITALFPQFDDNETLLSTCTSRDSLIHMDELCTEVEQRYNDQTAEDQWSHVVIFLNDALVKRIQSKGTAGKLSPSTYALKSDDFRDAHKAAKHGTVNLAGLFVMARELDLIENSDGILARHHATSPLRETQPAQRDSSPPPRPSQAPMSPAAVTKHHKKTHFNNPKYSDLTIILSDRRVYVHRVVLGTACGHFDSLLEDSHQVC